MSRRIEFIIPGPLASDHRRVESWFDRNGQRRRRPLVFRPRTYEQFRERARLALMKAIEEQGWVRPAKGVQMRMYVEIHVATHKTQKPKQLVDKRGRVLRPRLVPRQKPDHDNIEKCLKDALQKDRPKAGKPSVDPRYLYLDDKFVDCSPFPGQEWFVIEPGTTEWIRVALEVVGEFEPHVEQTDLIGRS